MAKLADCCLLLFMLSHLTLPCSGLTRLRNGNSTSELRNCSSVYFIRTSARPPEAMLIALTKDPAGFPFQYISQSYYVIVTGSSPLPNVKSHFVVQLTSNGIDMKLCKAFSILKSLTATIRIFQLDEEVHVTVELPFSSFERLARKNPICLHKTINFLKVTRSFLSVEAENVLTDEIGFETSSTESMIRNASMLASLIQIKDTPVAVVLKRRFASGVDQTDGVTSKVRKVRSNRSPGISLFHAQVITQGAVKRELMSTTTNVKDYVYPPITGYLPPYTGGANPVTAAPSSPYPVSLPVTFPPLVPTVPVTNPATTPLVTNPLTSPTTPYVPAVPSPALTSPMVATPVTNAPSIPGQSWCITRAGIADTALQLGLDYACGLGGADCSMIQPGAGCYNPNTFQSHASYAFNSYYQKNPAASSCDFGGSAIIVASNPSTSSCIYSTWSPTPVPFPTTTSTNVNPASTATTFTSPQITTPATAPPVPAMTFDPITGLNSSTNPAFGFQPPAGTGTPSSSANGNLLTSRAILISILTTMFASMTVQNR